MTKISITVTRLISQPSFVRGAARALDIGSTLDVYNTSPDESTADYWALLNDWYQVGDCLREAMESYDHA